MSTAFEEVRAALDSPSCATNDKIAQWSTAEDLPALGALVAFFDKYPARAKEALDPATRTDFYLRYLLGCLEQDPDADFCESRYLAGHSFTRWYLSLRKEPGAADSAALARRRLKETYLRGDADVKRAVVQGALEHLFEAPDVRREFLDWKADSELRPAYDEALKWAQSDPSTRLPSRRPDQISD